MYLTTTTLLLITTLALTATALPNPSPQSTQSTPNNVTTPLPFNNWPPLPIQSKITGQAAAQISWTSLTVPTLETSQTAAEAVSLYLEAILTASRLNTSTATGPSSTQFLLAFNGTNVPAISGEMDAKGLGDGPPGLKIFCPPGGMWPSKQFYLDVMGEIVDKVQRWGFVGVEFSVMGNRYETIVSGCSLGASIAPVST